MQTLQDLHNHVVKFIQQEYRNNTEADYDIIPFMHIVNDDQDTVIALVGPGNPMDMAGTGLRLGLANGLHADMVSFASAMWLKDPDGSGKRIGEGVIIRTESVLEQLFTSIEVKRNPLPELGEPKSDATVIDTRVPLLYQPTKPTEH